VTAGEGPWDHNLHYHPLVLAAVPRGASRALDAGCGEGVLARALARAVPHVVALDRHGPTLAEARRRDASGGRVAYVRGDLLSAPLAPESFDVVTAVASLHHGDEAAGLRRMAELLRPGGRLVVVGLARETVGGLPFAAASLVAQQWHHRWRHREQLRSRPESTAPIVWPPPHTYPELRRLAARLLPGARFRRHLLWRYSLTWTRPRPDSDPGPGPGPLTVAGRPSAR
jgi:SAM-dependent methyltransferase